MILVTERDVLLLLTLLMVSHHSVREILDSVVRRSTGIDLEDFETSNLFNVGFNMKFRIPSQSEEAKMKWKQKDEL